MISLHEAVNTIFYLIIAGVIFGLLFWLVRFTDPQEPIKKVANVVLAVLMVMVAIGILLSMVTGTPVFRP